MVHSLTALDDAQKIRILSGSKAAQVFLKDFCKEEFRVGDKLIISYPKDQPFGVYEVVEARECKLLDVGFDEAREAGYPLWSLMIDDLRKSYSGVQPDSIAIFVRWRLVAESL